MSAGCALRGISSLASGRTPACRGYGQTVANRTEYGSRCVKVGDAHPRLCTARRARACAHPQVSDRESRIDWMPSMPFRLGGKRREDFIVKSRHPFDPDRLMSIHVSESVDEGVRFVRFTRARPHQMPYMLVNKTRSPVQVTHRVRCAGCSTAMPRRFCLVQVMQRGAVRWEDLPPFVDATEEDPTTHGYPYSWDAPFGLLRLEVRPRRTRATSPRLFAEPLPARRCAASRRATSARASVPRGSRRSSWGATSPSARCARSRAGPGPISGRAWADLGRISQVRHHGVMISLVELVGQMRLLTIEPTEPTRDSINRPVASVPRSGQDSRPSGCVDAARPRVDAPS